MMVPTSERLEFKIWQPSDLDSAFSLWGDPKVMAYLGGTVTREEAADRVASEIACYEKHGTQYWPLFLKSDGAFIGCCGLRPWTYSAMGGQELGFHFVPPVWGQGFAVEAANAAISFARARHFSHLMSGHHPANIGSQKVLAKLGFEFVEGIFFPQTGLMHPSYILQLK